MVRECALDLLTQLQPVVLIKLSNSMGCVMSRVEWAWLLSGCIERMAKRKVNDVAIRSCVLKVFQKTARYFADMVRCLSPARYDATSA